jgi:hypothetical protein
MLHGRPIDADTTQDHRVDVTSPRPKIRTTNVVALCIIAVVVLCVGGAATYGMIVGDPKPRTTAAGEAPQELADIPTTSPTAAPPTKAKPRPTVTHKTASEPKRTTTKPRPRPTNTSGGQQGVHPGAFCSPDGAHGTTSAGTAMRCTRKAGEDRARWRKA